MKTPTCFLWIFLPLAMCCAAFGRIGESLSECEKRYGTTGFEHLGKREVPKLIDVDSLLKEHESNFGTNRLRWAPEAFYFAGGIFGRYAFLMQKPNKGDFEGAPYYVTRSGDIAIHMRFLNDKCVFLAFKKYGAESQFSPNQFSEDEVSELLKRNFGSKQFNILDDSDNSFHYYADDSKSPTIVAAIQDPSRPSEIVLFDPAILRVFSAENMIRQEKKDDAQKNEAEQNLKGF